MSFGLFQGRIVRIAYFGMHLLPGAIREHIQGVPEDSFYSFLQHFSARMQVFAVARRICKTHGVFVWRNSAQHNVWHF